MIAGHGIMEMGKVYGRAAPEFAADAVRRPPSRTTRSCRGAGPAPPSVGRRR
ncbi:hypothetical protein [Nonomuraea wenchangensis]|uniref:hypothetical protein n=1 Tax=Nonomuraea wenchangensis TaxID=568860 RepID=UPI0015A64890|nr:hypothetical protein [Nonomuraea wenchangensis]